MRPTPILRHRRPDLVDRATVPRGIRPPEPIPQTHSESASGLAALLGLAVPSSRLAVTESNVGGLAAVDAGVEMIAHAVATMMAEAKVFDANGDEIDPPAIVRRPTPLYGAYEFYSALVRVVMMRGNGPGVLADYFRGNPNGDDPLELLRRHDSITKRSRATHSTSRSTLLGTLSATSTSMLERR